ncbi:MAG TPA: hypothetical protein VNO14_10355 [Blastocatellia bacterium]|nr:hypothetical protein [Blastocatellia bacterium]
MQTRNRSAGATLGAAFLFLSFTAVPISLRAVGLDVRFSPSIDAVIDAWDEIAGAFQAGSQPLSTSELIALNNSNVAAPVEPPDAQPESECQIASRSEVAETGEACRREAIASTAAQAKARRPRAKTEDRSLLGGRPLTFATVRIESPADLEFRPIEVAHDLEDLAINREALLAEFKQRTAQYSHQMREALRFARASKEFKVIVRMSKPSELVRPAGKAPCPSRPDITPGVRKVRAVEWLVPDTETGEI